MRTRVSTRMRGWSLIELTIIITVLAVLVAILAPNIERYVRHAKVIRAREDVQMIGSAIWMYITDTGNQFFMQDGAGGYCLGASRQRYGGGAPNEYCDNRVNLLVGDGDVPELGIEGDQGWVQRVDFRYADFMEYHLITNRPGDNASRRYRTPLDLDKGATHAHGDPMFARDESGGFNSEFAWRGPYVSSAIDPDPWGNRYAANVGFLKSCGRYANDDVLRNGFTYDVIVMTAGPDEEVDTAFGPGRHAFAYGSRGYGGSAHPYDGLVPGDDDIAFLVSANGP